MSERLSKRALLSDYINLYKNELIKAIDKLNTNDNFDFDKKKKALVEQFTIEPVELLMPEPSSTQESTQNITDAWGTIYSKKIYTVPVILPFKGNGNLLLCKASSYTMVSPKIDRLDIPGQRIYFTVTLEELNVDTYNASVNKTIGDIQINIPQVNTEVAPWNNSLDNLVTKLLQERKGVVDKKNDFMEKIGLKVNKSTSEIIHTTPVAPRKIPQPVTESSKTIPKEKIPSLINEMYTDVLNVLYTMGKAIEKKPSIYLEREEETLRDYFNLILETRYESTTVTGEAFNKDGKTDILLKYQDGTNLFVAECKYWRGASEFHKAINQLFDRYLTWRDSKTALILFVQNEDFSSVLKTIQEETQKHPYFIKYTGNTGESSFSYEFHLPGDRGKTVFFEIMAFHFKKP